MMSGGGTEANSDGKLAIKRYSKGAFTLDDYDRFAQVFTPSVDQGNHL